MMRRRHSKKGRLAGGARKEINEGRASDAVSIAFMSEAERTRKKEVVDFVFGRITKITGANHVRVAIPAKKGSREVPARIPNIYTRRGATPITTRSVVTIYTGEDFDPDDKEVTGTVHFDVTSILTDRQVADLKKAGLIPEWMTTTDASDVVAGKTDDAGFVWATAEDDGDDDDDDDDDDAEDTGTGGKAAAGAGTRAKASKHARSDDSDDFDIDDI
jgi:hypothetical protein